MKCLAFDTATDACSVALWCDGQCIERYQVIPRQHTQALHVMIQEVLAEAGTTLSQCDAIAFTRGPGSFTGVRIAVSAAHGLAAATDLPLVPISTLEALAQGAANIHGEGQYLAGLDARMGEFYWANYTCAETGVVSANGEERLSAADSIEYPASGYAVGPAWCADVFTGVEPAELGLLAIERNALPRAVDVARLGCRDFKKGIALSPEQALPVYLRNQVTQNR